MADLNKVFLMGSLTFDPELRRTPSGTAVSELRLVTSRYVDVARRRAPRGKALHRRDRLGSPGRDLLRALEQGSGDPRRRLTQDGHLGRQEHRRKTLENPRACRSRAIPRQPSRRLARGMGGASDDELSAGPRDRAPRRASAPVGRRSSPAPQAPRGGPTSVEHRLSSRPPRLGVPRTMIRKTFLVDAAASTVISSPTLVGQRYFDDERRGDDIPSSQSRGQPFVDTPYQAYQHMVRLPPKRVAQALA